MNLEEFNKLKNLSTRIREKTVDIQQQINQSSSYVDPSYQLLVEKALAIQKEWKQLIIFNFVCTAITPVIGLCIVGVIGELGIFIAVPLTLPVTIHFGLEGIRLLLQGDPLNEFPYFRHKKT